MLLKEALEQLSYEYGAEFDFRDHFQNVVIRYNFDLEGGYNESYFSIYSAFPEDTYSDEELLLYRLEDLEFHFLGTYGYLWPGYNEIKEAVKTHIIERRR